MNSRVQHKPGDFSLGQTHEWVGAFGRQGGTPGLLQQSKDNAVIMHNVVQCMIRGERDCRILEVVVELVMGTNFLGTNVAKRFFGVGDDQSFPPILFSAETLYQYHDTHVLVFVPALSIADMRGIVGVNESDGNEDHCQFNRDAWFVDWDFADKKGEPGWHLVRRTVVPDSFGRPWEKQDELLEPWEQVPNTRVMVYTILAYRKKTGKWLFQGSRGLCADKIKESAYQTTRPMLKSYNDLWLMKCIWNCGHPEVGICSEVRPVSLDEESK